MVDLRCLSRGQAHTNVNDRKDKSKDKPSRERKKRGGMRRKDNGEGRE
jgi:hypothetical protein